MTSTTGSDSSIRWGGVGGIVFAVAFVVGILLMTDTPDSDESNREWIDYFTDSAHRRQIFIGALVLGLATIGFLVLLSVVREHIRASGAEGWLDTLLLASGVTFVTMLGVFGAAVAAVAAGVTVADAPLPRDADFMRVSESIGFGALLVFGMAAAGLFMIATSAGSGRAGLLPRWLVVSGYVAGVIVIIGGVFFIPMALLVLWVLAVSIVMLRQPSPRMSATV